MNEQSSAPRSIPEPGTGTPARRDFPPQLLPLLRDIAQIETVVQHEQNHFHEQLGAWRHAEATMPLPRVPDSYREAVRRLQTALAHLAVQVDGLSS